VGAVASFDRSCGTSQRPFLDSSQQCIQKRQTNARVSGKLLEVGARDWNIGQLASKIDRRINGSHLRRRSRPFLAKSASSAEENGGETNCQDNAWYARHVPFLSEKTYGKIVLPVHAPRRTPKRKQSVSALGEKPFCDLSNRSLYRGSRRVSH